MRVYFALLFGLFIFCTVSAQYKIGDIVDDISVTTYDESDDVSLEDFEEMDGVIVVFTSAKCAAARAYTRRLIELQKRYAPRGYPVLAIDISSQDEDRDEETKTDVHKYVEEQEINFSYAIDPERNVYDDFVTAKVPCVYLLKNQLEDEDDPGYRLIYYGAIDDNASEGRVTKHYLENALKYILKYPSKKVIRTQKGKKDRLLKSNAPFGCSLRGL